MTQAMRDYAERRRASLAGERADYEKEYRDISRFAQPARSRFLGDSRSNANAKRRMANSKLLDSYGVTAWRTLGNGMTSGLSSASRPWALLKAKGEMNDLPEVKVWLAEVEKRMFAFLASTNFYGAVKAGYAELGLFGTEACVMVEHPLAGAVCHQLTAGEYWIGLSDALVADTLLRVAYMTARQIVQQFGKGALPEADKSVDDGQHEQTYEIWHLIEPNPDHVEGRFASKAWRSIYWAAIGGKKRPCLRVSGFEEQPFWAPRWEVVGPDVYGTSPAMEALPDLRELQMQAKRRNEAIDFLVKPETLAKAGVRLTRQPGNVVSVANVENVTSVPYEMPWQTIGAIESIMDNLRSRIDEISYSSLFNAITNMRGVQPRNMEEIASRNEEKLTQLGPVIERVGNEKLKIAIERAFGIMTRGGLLPPAPQAMTEGGAEIEIEFVSILAQMQRLVGVGQIERTVSFVGNLAGATPDVLDKLDTDAIVDEYADRTGLPAHLIRSTADAKKIRAQRAEQAAQAEQASMMPAMRQGADAARLLSETDTGNGQSLLQQVMGGGV